MDLFKSSNLWPEVKIRALAQAEDSGSPAVQVQQAHGRDDSEVNASATKESSQEPSLSDNYEVDMTIENEHSKEKADDVFKERKQFNIWYESKRLITAVLPSLWVSL